MTGRTRLLEHSGSCKLYLDGHGGSIAIFVELSVKKRRYAFLDTFGIYGRGVNKIAGYGYRDS